MILFFVLICVVAGYLAISMVVAIPAFLLAVPTGFGLWLVFAPMLNYCDPFILIIPITGLYTIAGVLLAIESEKDLVSEANPK